MARNLTTKIKTISKAIMDGNCDMTIIYINIKYPIQFIEAIIRNYTRNLLCEDVIPNIQAFEYRNSELNDNDFIIRCFAQRFKHSKRKYYYKVVSAAGFSFMYGKIIKMIDAYIANYYLSKKKERYILFLM